MTNKIFINISDYYHVLPKFYDEESITPEYKL
jgi:hypothetical protein